MNAMYEWFAGSFSTLLESFDPVRDSLDIAIVSFAVYWLLMLIRGTRAEQMMLGLLIIVLAWLVSVQLEHRARLSGAGPAPRRRAARGAARDGARGAHGARYAHRRGALARPLARALLAVLAAARRRGADPRGPHLRRRLYLAARARRQNTIHSDLDGPQLRQMLMQLTGAGREVAREATAAKLEPQPKPAASPEPEPVSVALRTEAQ
jgi:hypothetical protein